MASDVSELYYIYLCDFICICTIPPVLDIFLLFFRRGTLYCNTNKICSWLFLRFRLRKAEGEVERLQAELADAEENMEEMEQEVEALMDSRAKMRVEIHDAHCQVGARMRECVPRRIEPSQTSMMLCCVLLLEEPKCFHLRPRAVCTM